MRTIKFRGKDIHNDIWVYGHYLYQYGKALITETPYGPTGAGYAREVDPSTVGQYTGRDDCEGNPIYEGDIIGLPSIYAKDQQGYTPFWVVEYDPWQGFKGFPREKVLGNIHDNPELMKADETGKD